jgi:adenylate kinase family enzyme
MAREVSARLGLPLLELDALAHRGGWDATPTEVFQEDLIEFIGGERWVVDGNYASRGTRDLVWPHADTFVWLDPPKRTVMRRVVVRTLRRVVTREKLWNELREPFTNLYSLDPYENIIVWSWTRFDYVRGRYETATTDGSWSHAEVYRLRTTRDVKGFLDVL